MNLLLQWQTNVFTAWLFLYEIQNFNLEYEFIQNFESEPWNIIPKWNNINDFLLTFIIFVLGSPAVFVMNNAGTAQMCHFEN